MSFPLGALYESGWIIRWRVKCSRERLYIGNSLCRDESVVVVEEVEEDCGKWPRLQQRGIVPLLWSESYQGN